MPGRDRIVKNDPSEEKEVEKDIQSEFYPRERSGEKLSSSTWFDKTLWFRGDLVLEWVNVA